MFISDITYITGYVVQLMDQIYLFGTRLMEGEFHPVKTNTVILITMLYQIKTQCVYVED